MRRLTALAAVVLIAGAGCSGSDEGGDTEESPEETTVTEPAPSPTAHEAVAQAFELDLQPPAGFVADDAERDFLVAEDHVTYGFALEGGSVNSRIMVTTYLLPEDTATGTYDEQVAIILPYDQTRGNTLSDGKHSPTIVHGYSGVYRNAKYEVGGEEVTQQNHYLFAGRHLIQITCQWNYDFNEVYQGCQEITGSFPYPAEWPIPYREPA